MIVEIEEEEGMKKGVWKIVNGLGEDEGKEMKENKEIKEIGFVGERRKGQIIMKKGEDKMKRVNFEIGGKKKVVVFEDEDMERDVDEEVLMIYQMNGER